MNIIPGGNLISNEGFREDATHCTESIHHSRRKIIPLVGPFPEQRVEADTEMDRRTFFWQYIMNDDHLFYLARWCDPAYTWLKEQNKQQQQEIINLKQRLLP